MSDVVLPQVLLGSESQLLAYAAQSGEAWFTPFPEMFSGDARLPEGATHLRFGGVRAVRVLKGARNVCVLAEWPGPALLTASHHPFASGTVVPAGVDEAWGLCGGAVRVTRIGGGKVACRDLPAGLIGRHLPNARQMAGRGNAGLDLACLANFQSDSWAAGNVAPAMPPAGGDYVLLPWNMDHPGGIVPELLERLARLGDEAPRMVLMPFNYVGQTGMIRDLIARLSGPQEEWAACLERIFIARVRALEGVPALRAISRVAWVDGNDPEHWWTIGRLEACGIATLLLDAGLLDAGLLDAGLLDAGLLDAGQDTPAKPSARLTAEERLWVEAETRWGALIFSASIPSWRDLPRLFAMTGELRPAPRRRRT